MAKVLIISNCQCKPLALVWRSLRPDDDVESYEVHTLIDKEDDIAGGFRRCELADIIVYNHIADNYPVPFARSSFLRALPRVTKIVVPNMFFEGLHPDIRYIGTSTMRVRSAMGDYNSRIVLRSFLQGLPPAAAEDAFASEDEYHKLGYFARFEASLDEMRRRDSENDIPGSEIIEAHVREVPTFFTTNHPMNILIRSTLIRVWKLLSLPHVEVPLEFLPPSLAGGPVWSVSDLVVRHHGLKYAASPLLKSDHHGQYVLGVGEFVRKSYYIYARCIEALAASPQVVQELRDLGIDPADHQSWLAARGQDGVRSVHLRGVDDAAAAQELSIAEVLRRRLLPDGVAGEAGSAAVWTDEIWRRPVDPDVQRKYIAALVLEGDIDKIEAYLADAVQRGTHAETAYPDMIAFQLEHRDAGQALRTAQAWAAHAPDSESAWRALAGIEDKLGNLPAAIEAAERARAIRPQDRLLQTSLAHLLAKAGQPTLAIAQLWLIAARFGENAHDLALLGLLHRRLGLLPAAAKSYRRAVDLAPGNRVFAHDYFAILVEAGSRQTAARFCDEMIARDIDAKAWADRLGVLTATDIAMAP